VRAARSSRAASPRRRPQPRCAPPRAARCRARVFTVTGATPTARPLRLRGDWRLASAEREPERARRTGVIPDLRHRAPEQLVEIALERRIGPHAAQRRDREHRLALVRDHEMHAHRALARALREPRAQRGEPVRGGLLRSDPHRELARELLLGALELVDLAHEDLRWVAALERARDEHRRGPIPAIGLLRL
jgi:hypothetical protein